MTTLRVPRRVHEVSADPGPSAEPHAASSAEASGLADYRDASAYVLLGEPGSGKTTAFEMECGADPEGSRPVSARDFVELEVGRNVPYLRGVVAECERPPLCPEPPDGFSRMGG